MPLKLLPHSHVARMCGGRFQWVDADTQITFNALNHIHCLTIRQYKDAYHNSHPADRQCIISFEDDGSILQHLCTNFSKPTRNQHLVPKRKKTPADPKQPRESTSTLGEFITQNASHSRVLNHTAPISEGGPHTARSQELPAWYHHMGLAHDRVE